MRASALGLVLTTICCAAHAQAPAPAATVSGVTVTAHRATPVSAVTVTAGACPEPDATKSPSTQPPHVLDSYPVQGAVVRPGAAVIRVSFDAPMSCYWDVSAQSSLDDDPCQAAGRWTLPDRTTWTMDCKLASGASYTLRFGKNGGQGFVGLSGKPAQPYRLEFSTSDAAPVATLDQARRLDPGPPGGTKAIAYVTCQDLPPGSQGRDCRHTPITEPHQP